jgi:hypothetical protein
LHIPEVSDPLTHVPTINVQISAIWLTERFVERERHRSVHITRDVQVKRRNEESDSSISTRKTLSEVAFLPTAGRETRKMPAFTFTEESSLVEDTWHEGSMTMIHERGKERMNYLASCQGS